jgi:hypothetical protein
MSRRTGDAAATRKSALLQSLVQHCGKTLTPETIDVMLDELLVQVRTGPMSWAFRFTDSPTDGKHLKYMTEPELRDHLNHQLRFIKSCETVDTIGSMLIIFGDDNISQYGATVDPETAPQALRELADRIEARETVKREKP